MRTLRFGVLVVLSCGGGGFDPCPTGDCTLPGSTIVKFTFDHYPEKLFASDTCLDMGAVTVHVDGFLVDDPTIVAAKDVACGEGQATLLDLVPGMWDVAVTPLDAAGAPIVKAATHGQVAAADRGMVTDTTINVPWDAWTRTYTGTFLFRINWGGVSCETAVPPVATQNLKLVAGDKVVHKLDDQGHHVDGDEDAPCRPLSEPFAAYVEGLAFGPATLEVVGKDVAGERKFEHEFETFIGADKNNPTIVFDVPAELPDAGVDAPAADAPAD